MDFKVKRKDLMEGLALTIGVVEKKNTMPILSNVLIEAQKEGLKILATDLEVAVTCSVAAQVMSVGKITVMARSLQDIVRESADEEIRFTLGENDRIELSSGLAKFKIPGLNASEFPTFPNVEAKPVDISCEAMLDMVEKTGFSMANDETRYNLNGVFLQKRGDNLVRMVATDGHRLSMVDREIPLSSLEGGVIIPKKGVQELKKLLGPEGNFELALGKKGLVARRGGQSLYIRYLDGEFPEYNAVIPTENNFLATISRQMLAGALRRVSLLSNERSKGVVFAFSPGHLEVSAANPDLGEAREEISIDYKGQKVNIGFNARYVLDVLEVLKDETVTFALKGETTACLIRSTSDKGFLCVVMPMRI